MFLTWSSLVVFCASIVLCEPTGESNSDSVMMSLRKVQSSINANVSSFCFQGHSGSKQAFVSNKYHAHTDNLNVLIYPFCLVTKELGNKLGNFFTELGCAHAAGLHFVSVHHQWDISGSFHGNMTNATYATDDHKLAFLNALPSIVVHPNPVSRSNAIDKVQHVCKCTRYCWEHGNAAWVNRTEVIGHYIRQAVTAYLRSVDVTMGTVVDGEVDFSNATPGQQLPIVPTVALQYRCGDNIGFSYMYGILPFTAFDKLIPANAKYIYVLSDHPSRAVHTPYTGRCALILQKLFEYLLEKNPRSTIVVKRGGDIFMDYVRLSRANVTICSASSFCLWPAIANVDAQVYFPLTSLAAGADSMDLAPNLGQHFHWIEEPKIISNFKNMRPWTAIIDVLQAYSLHGQMPIQPINKSNYTKITDVEDITPVGDNYRIITSLRGQKYKYILVAIPLLTVVLLIMVYYGVRKESATEISVYQTSLLVSGGLLKYSHTHNPDQKAASVSENTGKVFIDVKDEQQTVIGFGGAFTESTAVNFQKLSHKVQQQVMELYFGKDGIGLTLGRVHINSCDFSLDSYNYATIAGDYDLAHFDSDIPRDSTYALPMVRRAMSLAASSGLSPLRILASPWSPPPWMKAPRSGNYSMTGSAQPNGLRADPQNMRAWAAYFVKFVAAYRQQDVTIWAVTPQNEPEFAAPWEACAYNATFERDFIRDYLGPAMRAAFPEVKILGFDHNKDHLLHWAQTLFADPLVAQFVDGMAFHWYGGNDRATDGTYGYEAVNATHHLLAAQAQPKILLATEGCSCPGVRLDDWLRAERLGHDVMYDLLNSAQGWIDWNLLLDAEGGPNHLGNQCDAALVALPDLSGVHVQPKYYYFGHFSKFVTPGALRVGSAARGDFGFRSMDPRMQAGVELGMHGCERSVRQTWRITAAGQLVLLTEAQTTLSFSSAGTATTNHTVQLCASRGDANRPYLRLDQCDDENQAGGLHLSLTDSGQLQDAVSGQCLELSTNTAETGALLVTADCLPTDSAAAARQLFVLDPDSGEITVQAQGDLCLTAGWPFFSAVAFVSRVNATTSTVVVVMNEADEAVSYDLVEKGKTSATAERVVIEARSIQTVVY